MTNSQVRDLGNLASAPEEHDDERGCPDLSNTPIFADDALLSHFLNSLLVKVELLSDLIKKGDQHRNILGKVKSEIANFKTDKGLNHRERISHAWINAFRLELLLALAEPSERLIPELEARLGQADEEKVSGAIVGRLRGIIQQIALQQSNQTAVDPKEKDCRLRSMLTDIIQKIQWELTKKYALRNLQRKASRNIVIATLVAFFIFLLPYGMIFLLYKLANDNIDYFKGWIGLPLVLSLTAGLFGAYFSRLIYIQKNWSFMTYDELKSAGEPGPILLRGIIGICGATIIFFFLHANIINGSLVPNFSDMTMKVNALGSQIPSTLFIGKDLGLLFVWSFIAGFSERLVPNILGRTEMRFDETSRPPHSIPP